jgi:hypothetical protein
MSGLCVKCQKPHGMVLEDTITGEIEEIDMCYDCLFAGFKMNIITTQITLSDCENLNTKLVDELMDRLDIKENESCK